jgi:hypothetical protein
MSRPTSVTNEQLADWIREASGFPPKRNERHEGLEQTPAEQQQDDDRGVLYLCGAALGEVRRGHRAKELGAAASPDQRAGCERADSRRQSPTEQITKGHVVSGDSIWRDPP